MGFWEGFGKIAISILNELGKTKCPNCKSSNFKYGSSLIKNFGVSNLVDTFLGLATNNSARVLNSTGTFLSNVINSFANQVIDKVPSNPLLQCLDCNIYFIECTSCSESQGFREYPTAGNLYQCGNCDNKFSVCERSDKFDNLVK